MHSIPVVCRTASRVALTLLLMFGASGCKKIVKFTCADQTVNVNTTNGAEPQAVYVCEGDTVTWNSNGLTFVVEFKKDSPFVDGGKKFDNGHPKSDKTKPHKQITVYEYRITVNGTAFDPQVIAGGGTP